MRGACVPAALAIVGATIAHAAPARDSTATLHPGIVHEHWTDTSIPAAIDLVRVDLTSAELAVVATAEADKGKTTAGYAAEVGAAVAISGGPFAVAGYRPLGLAMGDGALWSQTADDATLAVLHVRREGEATVATIVAPETIVAATDLPAGTQGVLSGRPLLVRAGSVEASFDCADDVAIPCTRAPRAAAGLSADGHTLLLATVDGWQAGSLGMTAGELATFLRARGADAAVQLDAGAAATLVLDGALASHPSDGVARTLANHLAIQYGALPKGEMFGVICEGSLTNCTTAGIGGRVTGATVTLDDGRVLTSATTGCPNAQSCASYDFTGVTQRLACVTVKKAGYRSAHKCEQVIGGQITYNSLVLTPGTDPIDAGVPDAAETVVDGGGSGSNTLVDGGTTPGGGGGGGCCDAGSSPPPFAAFGLVALVARRVLQRRRRP